MQSKGVRSRLCDKWPARGLRWDICSHVLREWQTIVQQGGQPYNWCADLIDGHPFGLCNATVGIRPMLTNGDYVESIMISAGTTGETFYKISVLETTQS